MREYASVYMIEYAGTFLKKQSAEHDRILNVPGAIHDIRLLHKLLSSCRDKDVFTTLSNS